MILRHIPVTGDTSLILPSFVVTKIFGLCEPHRALDRRLTGDCTIPNILLYYIKEQRDKFIYFISSQIENSRDYVILLMK